MKQHHRSKGNAFLDSGLGMHPNEVKSCAAAAQSKPCLVLFDSIVTATQRDTEITKSQIEPFPATAKCPVFGRILAKLKMANSTFGTFVTFLSLFELKQGQKPTFTNFLLP